MLRSGDGGKKEYLLLRIIPVESVRKIWVFPVEYMSAEIGMITKSGAYICHINRRLRETAKVAEEAGKAKTQFLSTMSHDIRRKQKEDMC